MTKRTTIGVFVVLAICFVVALALIPSPEPPRTRPPAGTATMMNDPPVSRLDKDAVQAVERELGTMFVRCGQEYRTQLIEWQGNRLAVAVPRTERYREVRFTAQAQALTDVDSLNQVDWTGAVLMTARAWASDAGGRSGEWQAFPGRELSVRRKSGQWEVASPDGWIAYLRGKNARRPSCQGGGPR